MSHIFFYLFHFIFLIHCLQYISPHSTARHCCCITFFWGRGSWRESRLSYRQQHTSLQFFHFNSLDVFKPVCSATQCQCRKHRQKHQDYYSPSTNPRQCKHHLNPLGGQTELSFENLGFGRPWCVPEVEPTDVISFETPLTTSGSRGG